MNIPDTVLYLALAILVAGATARLTRFVVTDSLGQWLKAPIVRWAQGKEDSRVLAVISTANTLNRGDMTPRARRYLDGQLEAVQNEEPVSWQMRLVSGLDCPFCVGFWIGLVVLSITLTLVVLPFTALWIIWAVLMAALALNYVVAHISSRID